MILFLSNIIFLLILLENFINASQYESKKYSDIVIRHKKALIYKNYKLYLPVRFNIDYYLNTSAILKAINRIESKTCVYFHQQNYKAIGWAGFNFVSSKYCKARYGIEIGNNDNENKVELSKECKDDVDAIEGLVGHMLGLLPEVRRPDRDNYIKVNFNDMKMGEMFRYSIYHRDDTETYGLGFDAYAGVQFRPLAYSSSSKPLFEGQPNYPYFQTPNDRRLSMGLVFNDYKVLTLHNNCYDIFSKNKIKCENFGYLKPYKKICICPDGFTGDRCEKADSANEACLKRDSMLVADSKIRKIYIDGISRCTFIIKAKKDYKVKVEILFAVLPYGSICRKDSGVEIKYIKDKGATGLLACGETSNISVTSEDDNIVLVYNGWSDLSEIIFSYTEYKPPSNI